MTARLAFPIRQKGRLGGLEILLTPNSQTDPLPDMDATLPSRAICAGHIEGPRSIIALLSSPCASSFSSNQQHFASSRTTARPSAYGCFVIEWMAINLPTAGCWAGGRGGVTTVDVPVSGPRIVAAHAV